MPFQAVCCCPRHNEWKHGKVNGEQLRQCTREEASVLNLASEDPKNKGRKRKICVSCRSRLHAEVKCQKLEVRFTPSFVHIQFMPFWICFVHKLSLKYSALFIGKALSNNKSFYVCRVGLFYLDIFTGFGLFQFKCGMCNFLSHVYLLCMRLTEPSQTSFVWFLMEIDWKTFLFISE